MLRVLGFVFLAIGVTALIWITLGPGITPPENTPDTASNISPEIALPAPAPAPPQDLPEEDVDLETALAHALSEADHAALLDAEAQALRDARAQQRARFREALSPALNTAAFETALLRDMLARLPEEQDSTAREAEAELRDALAETLDRIDAEGLEADSGITAVNKVLD